MLCRDDQRAFCREAIADCDRGYHGAGDKQPDPATYYFSVPPTI